MGSGEGVVEVELEEPQLKLARVATAGNASRTSKRRYFQSILTVILAFAMGAVASPIRFVNLGLRLPRRKRLVPGRFLLARFTEGGEATTKFLKKGVVLVAVLPNQRTRLVLLQRERTDPRNCSQGISRTLFSLPPPRTMYTPRLLTISLPW